MEKMDREVAIMVMMAENFQRKMHQTMGCEGCGGKDHDIDDCQQQCGFCKEPGHRIDDCLKLQ
jgi:hypothetical protein